MKKLFTILMVLVLSLATLSVAGVGIRTKGFRDFDNLKQDFEDIKDNFSKEEDTNNATLTIVSNKYILQGYFPSDKTSRSGELYCNDGINELTYAELQNHMQSNELDLELNIDIIEQRTTFTLETEELDLTGETYFKVDRKYLADGVVGKIQDKVIYDESVDLDKLTSVSIIKYQEYFVVGEAINDGDLIPITRVYEVLEVVDYVVE